MQIVERLAPSFESEFVHRLQTHSSGSTFMVGAAESSATPITVRTVLEVHDTGPHSGVEEIFVVGLQTDASDSQAVLTLVWAPTGTSWLGPTWALQLHSELGLHHPDNHGPINLRTASPNAGHVYEAYLSYDAMRGALSLSVIDLTDEKVLYKGELQVGQFADTVVPFAGLHTSLSDANLTVLATTEAHAVLNGLATIQCIGSIPMYLPVGGDWMVGSVSDSGAFLPVQRFGSAEMISLRLPPTPPDHGTFQLSVERLDGTISPLDIPMSVSAHSVQLSAADLPWGTANILLDFISPTGDVLMTGSRTVTIGRIEAYVAPLRVERDGNLLRGTLRVASDGPRVGAQLTLTAVFTRTEWDQESYRYTNANQIEVSVLENAVEFSHTGKTISFTLPFPEPERPGLWRVSLHPQLMLDAQVPVTTSGEPERLFTTYSPANNLATKPFTIVVLPDTQEYPKSYPHIFTRQTDWIAANAETLNIGTVVSVGDIVDNNEVQQWERASQSLHVLDGVVPYVLAVGNHDIRVFFSPTRSLFNREGALLNTYFPISNAETNSNLGGVFRPNRLENSYSLFSFGDADYLVLSLEWGPRDSVLDWANAVLADHPHHKVIITTHAFTAPDGGWVTTDRFPVALPAPNDFVPEPSSVNSAREIWSKLIDHHANVLLVLSGHMGMDAIAHRTRVGKQGNTVFEIVTNYQTHPNGGNGWLVLLTFTPDEQIVVQAFSPYLCEHRYDIGPYGFGHNFVIDVAEGRVRPFNGDVIGACGR